MLTLTTVAALGFQSCNLKQETPEAAAGRNSTGSMCVAELGWQ